ncbi:MAG: hypothetical protein EA422_03960 [Gemmatimonadales bacterium]|nr:MAG: hypothetical protein EA422_03960 [Gemmatimonadales bacterium]
MKRRSLWSAIFLTATLAACGPGELVVTAEAERMNPETGEMELRPLENVAIQLLPFDRDHIFDSLTAAADTPEPQMPPELAQARDAIIAAQTEWREAEAQWLEQRERLQQISDEMAQFNPGEARYRELFAEFNAVESQVLSAEARRDSAFEEFTDLQAETLEELDRLRIEIEIWEDDAFEDYPEIVAARLQETRKEIMADTTDATGSVRMRPAPGQWWVHARQQLTTEELYWNVPVTVERGDPVQLRLTRENARIRDVF